MIKPNYRHLITQLAYVFVCGIFAYSEASLFIASASCKVLEFVSKLPPYNNGIYFLFISVFLLSVNIMGMSLFTMEIIFKKKYFPEKSLAGTKVWISTLAVSTPVYLLLASFYFELIYERFIK